MALGGDICVFWMDDLWVSIYVSSSTLANVASVQYMQGIPRDSNVVDPAILLCKDADIPEDVRCVSASLSWSTVYNYIHPIIL